MAVYLALFSVMWKYAPADDDDDEGEQDDGDDCCSLLGGGTGGAVGGAGQGGTSSANHSMDHTRPGHSTTERGTDGGELGLGGFHSHPNNLRNPSVDSRPTVGGSLGFGMGSGSAPAGYDINSRNSSFASVRSDRSARKNSIAEVGLRTAFG